MSNHWQEAQEAARKTWANFVSTVDQKAWIAGSSERGWIILSSKHNLQLVAKTEQDVERALEELGLPALSWQ